ncbi:MAG TPA: hemolysin family protein [Candidatus Binatia bacterium]|nr:hemolysin family protein [Candidatus Binatia bacterium]
MSAEFFILFSLIIANGLLAMSEMAIVTARKSRLQDWVNRGQPSARTALDLARSPDRFISTAQAGMTLGAVLAGAFAGGELADGIARQVAALPVVGPHHREAGMALAIATVAYLSLVIGALVPKRLALRSPETIAAAVALPLSWLTKLFSPVLRLLEASTDAVCRLFGKPRADGPPVTEEEIKTLVQQGTEAGVFEESEQDMVEAVLRLGDKSARWVMTPRTQIAWLDLQSTTDQIRQKIISSGHSCFPVARGSLDEVSGVVSAKAILAHLLAGETLDLRALMQQPLFVPRTLSVLEVLDLFKKSGKHIALVVDEYGGIEGLLTHHDLLEAIAGDIPFGSAAAEPKAVKRHDGSWLLDGMLSVDEFKEIFHLASLPGEKRDAYQTLGGFVFTRMGRIPAVSDAFEWNGLRFEVVDMDGKRIDKVLVSELTQTKEESRSAALHERD